MKYLLGAGGKQQGKDMAVSEGNVKDVSLPLYFCMPN